jgi:hypothetical protein
MIFMRNLLTSFFEKLADKTRRKEPQIAAIEEIREVEPSLPQPTKIPKKRKPRVSKNLVSTDLHREILASISPQKMKLISTAEEIRLDPDKAESAFIARQLVQATLPHKNPGDVQAWSRKNGNLTLTIRPGWNLKKEKSIGYPYGTLPRLLLFWITTEAVRTKSPRIELGESLSNFMGKLGLDSSRGGKRSDSKRLKEQMIRLFRATISFEQSVNGRDSWIDMQVAPKGMLCWDERFPDQEASWESYIQLGDDFFKAIIASPVPVDIRALKVLKGSPLALDLYAWATYTAYQTQQTGKERSISWSQLHEQFGAGYNTIKNFSAKAWKAFVKVQLVYPNLNIEPVPGGIKILPSNPSITVKKTKKIDSTINKISYAETVS